MAYECALRYERLSGRSSVILCHRGRGLAPAAFVLRLLVSCGIVAPFVLPSGGGVLSSHLAYVTPYLVSGGVLEDSESPASPGPSLYVWLRSHLSSQEKEAIVFGGPRPLRFS